MEKEGFRSLGLSDEACDAMERMRPGKPPDAFLSKSLPYLLSGRDFTCLVREKHRSLKIAAYLGTMFEKLKPHNAGQGVRALIVTATRDMASDIFERANKFFTSTDIVLVLLDGGESELERLGHQKPDVVIVNVDTLIQQLNSAAADDGIMSLSTVELLVIDGASEMLRLGFDDHLKKILGMGQAGELDRQTLLYTTELTDEVRALAKKFLRPHLLGIPVRRYDMMLEKISSLALGGQEQPCVGLGQPNNLQGPCPPPAPSHCSDAKKKKRKKRATHDGMEDAGRLKKRAANSMDED